MKKAFSRVMILGVFLSTIAGGQGFAFAQSQMETRYFPETQQSISGRFLEYWTQNGGLLQQGYPISPEMQELSPIDGKTYTVQYFERAVFELHLENQRPYDVLLSLLGVLAYHQKYPNGAPNQIPNNDPGSVLFKETGKRVGGSFLVYFNAHGGVTQQGLPISDELQERSDLDGKTRTVQYFERAVFEWNPSNEPPYNVLLSQLGTFAYKAKNSPPPPEQPIQEPVIPAPADSRKYQFGPQASNDYLVWYEGIQTGPADRGNYFDLDIMALDLHTNKPITVTTASENQTQAAIDGSLVAWRNESYGCMECIPAGLYAKDLATGMGYEIVRATSDKFPANPVVAGRTVAWLEFGTNKQSILAKNVDTGNTIEVKSVLTNTPSISGLEGSGRFLVWSELDYSQQQTGPSGYPYSIQAYDLTTGRQFEVVAAHLDSGPDFAFPSYSLSGNRLAVSIKPNSPFVFDLLTNKRIDLLYSGNMQNVALYGDKLLFSTSIDAFDVYGIDLSSPDMKAVSLLQTPPNTPPQDAPRYQAAVVGGWLVWSNSMEPQSRLNHKKLDLTP